MPDHWLKNTRKRPALAWTLSILWLLLIGWLAFFWNLGSTGLIDETEPLFAEAARQMVVTGDWITPFFNGETRFDKPPLIYWLMAIAYSALGVNEWAVRLPSALSAMGLVSLGFYTLLYFGSQNSESTVPRSSSEVFPRQTATPCNNTDIFPFTTVQGMRVSLFVGQNCNSSKFKKRRYWFCAALGSALMALNLQTIVWARTGVSDMLLTGCMGSALLSFFLGYAGKKKVKSLPSGWYLAFYVLIALGILTKGPVGIILPGLIIGSFLLYLGNALEVLREMRAILGGLLIVAIALPWYILVTWRNGWAYINSFFGYHNLERFTGVVNHHSAPWYFYFLVVLLGFAPWSIYLPPAIARLKFWKRSHWQAKERSTQLGLFALFWFTGVFGFFTIAVTKLPSYVLPLMPAAAILVALLLSDEIKIKLSGWLNVVFLLAVAVGLFCTPYWLGTDPAIPKLRSYVQQSGLPVLGSVIWAITAASGAVLLLRRRWRWFLSVNLLGFLAFLIFVLTPTYFLLDRARQLPLRELSAIARAVERPGEDLIMIGFKKPTVVFYTKKTVTYVKETEDAAAYIENLAATKAHPSSVLILSQPKRLKKLGLQPTEYQNLGKAGAYQLIRVFKSRTEN